MSDIETKIGLYICTGCDIGNALEADKLVETIEGEGDADVIKVHEFMCSDDAVNVIKGDITSEGLNRVIIFGCSLRFNSDVFNFGPEVLVERVPAREYVTWCHKP